MMNKKMVSLRIFSLGDMHAYNKNHIRNIRTLMHAYHPDLILCVSDFPHDQGDLSDFRFVSYFVPGNHELFASSSALNNIMYDGRFICNNLRYDGYLPFKEDTLVPFKNKGLNVRIFGMTYFPEEEKKSMRPQYQVDPIQESIANTAQRIKYLDNKYCPPDFTIGLTHIGIANDVCLFNTLTTETNISRDRLLIVGGHNHILNPRLQVSSRTSIVHSGSNMQAIGIIDVDFHADGSVHTKAENKSLANIRTTATILDNKEECDDRYSPLGVDYSSLDYFHMSKLGAWFTKRLSELTNSDIVLINGGTLREALDRRYTPKLAKITAEKIIYFKENQMITFQATKQQIIEIIKKEVDLLNKSAGTYDIGTLNNKLYLQVFGIKYTVVKTTHNTYELNSVSFDKQKKEHYTVTAPDFLWHAYQMEEIIGVNNYRLVGQAMQLMENALALDDLFVPPGIYDIKRIIRK